MQTLIQTLQQLRSSRGLSRCMLEKAMVYLMHPISVLSVGNGKRVLFPFSEFAGSMKLACRNLLLLFIYANLNARSFPVFVFMEKRDAKASRLLLGETNSEQKLIKFIFRIFWHPC